ncbi:hypothetical protein Hanom_Chr12g01112811 [Helianthus anomalus]
MAVVSPNEISDVLIMRTVKPDSGPGQTVKTVNTRHFVQVSCWQFRVLFRILFQFRFPALVQVRI